MDVVVVGAAETGDKDNNSQVNNRANSFHVNWKKLLKKRLPIFEWLPRYSFGTFLQDALAGVTVGLTEIPQGIAYAAVAGLEPQYGLYSGFMGCFVYAIFGSCKDINIGPTAIMALMAQSHISAMGPDAAVLLTFLSGCIIFVLGLLHLGFLVEFFSYPVIAGFTSAAALQIAASQLKSLLGIPGKANEFLEAIVSVVEHITETRKWDAILGIVGIVVLVLLKQLRDYGSLKYRPEWSRRRNILGRIYFLISLGRNALVVIAGTTMAWVFHQYGYEPFKLTGSVGEGLPPFEPPPFSTEFKNETFTFGDMAKEYGTAIAFTPLVAILESIAIAKAFSKGKTLDATQEMLALGICNIMGSFVRSMPVTGSFTRTAVNNASGVQTVFGGIITGLMVLLALGLLTSTFYYIPKATLASVVICAMFYLFDFEAIVTLWKTKKQELIPFLVTLLASLFIGLEYGILIGIGTNLIFVLYSSARPPVYIEKEKVSNGDVFLVTPTRSLQFPAAEYVREKVMKECDYKNTTVVIDGKYIRNIDATVAKNFKVLSDDLKLRGQSVIFWNFKESVTNVCAGIDKNLLKHFKDGSLEDIIEEPPQGRIIVDVAYSINQSNDCT